MKPQNSKSLLSFIFEQMEKLDNNTIDTETAKAQANFAKQANNILRYELDRVKTEMKLKEHNVQYGTMLELRNVEIKNFD